MSTDTLPSFPIIDAAKQSCITPEQAQFFRDYGLLHIRNLLRGDELRLLQEQTLPLVQKATASKVDDPDYAYMKHRVTGREVPYRIEYIIDKTKAGKALLGHPFILQSIQMLQGRNFLPTWDSMVFKLEGMGAQIVWHRDGEPYPEQAADIDHPVAAINVDFYLDGSDLTNCLWGILGSNRWKHKDALAKIDELNRGDKFNTEGAVPIPVQPGDVLFHSILALHGSPAAQSKLRRVMYYEFRPIPVELKYGPHKPEYVPLKQKVLLAALRERAEAAYARGEQPFVYQPEGAYAAPALGVEEKLSTWRYKHSDFFRTGEWKP